MSLAFVQISKMFPVTVITRFFIILSCATLYLSVRYVSIVQNPKVHVIAQRRILAGRPLAGGPKPFMVYLVKAPSAAVDYDAWICGGVIVSPRNVVTAAACVEDVKHAYVISGYDRYINHANIANDPCTSYSRKKIIYVCLPKTYDFAYDKVEKWANIDIAVARVETPFNIYQKPSESCSYAPAMLPINYDPKFQTPDTDAYILGWGHQELWRQVFDKTDYNSPCLLYAPTKIQNKSICLEQYSRQQKLTSIIDKFMLCAFGEGGMDSDGNPLDNKNITLLLGCNEEEMKSQSCVIDFARRSNNQSIKAEMDKYIIRRAGICQNDHGGPLITWVGSKEYLIGVASVFRITTTSQCTGPFLYTSTVCTSAFLNCIVSSDLDAMRDKYSFRRAASCQKQMEKNGMTLVERNISWINHPDGPAANEIVNLKSVIKPGSSKTDPFKPIKVTRGNILTTPEPIVQPFKLPMTMQPSFLRFRPQRPIKMYFRKHQDQEPNKDNTSYSAETITFLDLK